MAWVLPVVLDHGRRGIDGTGLMVKEAGVLGLGCGFF